MKSMIARRRYDAPNMARNGMKVGPSADVDNNREKVILWIIQIWYRNKLDMLAPKRTEIIVTRFDEDWKKYFTSILVLKGVF